MDRWETALVERMYSQDESGSIEIFEQGFPANFQVKLKHSTHIPKIKFTYPLILSVELSLPMVTKYLLKARAPLHCKDSAGRCPLVVATTIGDLRSVRLLIIRGADITCRDNEGNSILHIAVKLGHYPLIKYFVYHLKIPVRVVNFKKQTPLTLAKIQKENSKSLCDVGKFQNIIELLWKADTHNETANGRFGKFSKEQRIILPNIQKDSNNQGNFGSIKAYLTAKHFAFAKGPRLKSIKSLKCNGT